MGLLPSAQGQPAAISVTAAMLPGPPPAASASPSGQLLGQPETPVPGTIPPPVEVPQDTVGPVPPKAAAAPAPPPVEKSAEAPAMGGLSDIWVKIVAQLRPMGTQLLMRQHGQLMACDGVEARVGITNDKLMRMAQDRLSNVETAFEKVFGHQIRVTMAVVTVEQVVESASPSAAPAAPPPRPVPKVAAKPTDVKPDQIPIVEPSSDHSQGTQATPAAAPAVGDWQSEGDLERSVKSFAQFFNGQIVNLDEDVTESAQSSSAQSSTPSTEPGPDVPF